MMRAKMNTRHCNMAIADETRQVLHAMDYNPAWKHGIQIETMTYNLNSTSQSDNPGNGGA
jgi:hypothetical protein